MMFEGKYYNGVDKAGYPARVTLSSYGVDISYISPVTGQQSLHWLHGKVHPADLTGKGTVYLKYGDALPYQYLEVNDAAFEAALKDTYPEAKFHKQKSVLLSTGVKVLVGFVLIVVGLLLLGYFYALPAIADSLAKQVPISWEEKFGEASYEQMIVSEKRDMENSQRANAFFKTMGYSSEYKIDITVTKNPIVNAYALPGGKIVVYEGILKGIDSYQEFAALLSHEYSHVALRHTTKSVFRSLSGYVLLSMLFGDASGVGGLVIENADQLKQLGYSRGLEEEADRNGLMLMKQKGIEPEGMQDLLNTLKEEEGSNTNAAMEFLSTHPLTKERMKYVREDIDKHDYTVKEHAQLDSLWSEIKLNMSDDAEKWN